MYIIYSNRNALSRIEFIPFILQLGITTFDTLLIYVYNIYMYLRVSHKYPSIVDATSYNLLQIVASISYAIHPSSHDTFI